MIFPELQRDIDLENRLGVLISKADEGKISLQDLYEKAKDLKDEILDMERDIWDHEFDNLLLVGAFNEIYLLHDRDGGVNLGAYKDPLLGKKEVRFKRRWDKQPVEIIYHPYADPQCKDSLVEVKETEEF